MTRPRVRRQSYRKVAFLRALKETGNVGLAGSTSGVPRGVLYRWRNEDKRFARLWDECLEYAYDLLEETARKRAVEGVREPVFYQGDVVGHVVKYSDRMLEILLRANRSKFKPNHDGSRDDGAGVVIIDDL